MENINKYAQLFKILCEKFDGSNKLGKKATQKMFYFFEREGIELNLRYGIHFYGPYSSKLDNIMHALESEDYISIDTSRSTHVISIGNEKIEYEGLPKTEYEQATKVINYFGHKTPLELEALSTMDYVANFILNTNSSDQQIISKFKEIKGEKFSKETINSILKELKDIKLITS